MSRRISINEAEEVVLGATGRLQQIPVLETLSDGSHKPGKTTPQALKRFTGGGAGATTPEIHRFEISDPLTGIVITSSRQRAGGTGPPTVIKWRKPSGSLISGTANFFRLVSGEIQLPRAGAYRYTLEAYTIRTGGTGEVNLDDFEIETDDEDFEFRGSITLDYPVYIGSIYTRQGSRICRHYGTTQAVSQGTNQILTPFADARGILIANRREPIRFQADVYNAGNVAEGRNRINWRFTTTGQNTPCSLIIEKI